MLIYQKGSVTVCPVSWSSRPFNAGVLQADTDKPLHVEDNRPLIYVIFTLINLLVIKLKDAFSLPKLGFNVISLAEKDWVAKLRTPLVAPWDDLVGILSEAERWILRLLRPPNRRLKRGSVSGILPCSLTDNQFNLQTQKHNKHIPIISNHFCYCFG